MRFNVISNAIGHKRDCKIKIIKNYLWSRDYILLNSCCKELLKLDSFNKLNENSSLINHDYE